MAVALDEFPSSDLGAITIKDDPSKCGHFCELTVIYFFHPLTLFYLCILKNKLSYMVLAH